MSTNIVKFAVLIGLFYGQTSLACIDFTGNFGALGAMLTVVQPNCETITIAGAEPSTGWGMSSGLNQPIDNEYHEYVYAEGGMGNYQPLVKPKPNQKPKIRVKLNRVGDELEYHQETDTSAYDQKEPKWDFYKMKTFSFESNGKLKMVATGKDWGGNPYRTEHISERHDVYLLCEGSKTADISKLALKRRSDGMHVIYVTKNENKRLDANVFSVIDMGNSKGFVFEKSELIEKTLVADLEVSSAAIHTVNLSGTKPTLLVDGLKCRKGDWYLPF